MRYSRGRRRWKQWYDPNIKHFYCRACDKHYHKKAENFVCTICETLLTPEPDSEQQR